MIHQKSLELFTAEKQSSPSIEEEQTQTSQSPNLHQNLSTFHMTFFFIYKPNKFNAFSGLSRRTWKAWGHYGQAKLHIDGSIERFSEHGHLRDQGRCL